MVRVPLRLRIIFWVVAIFAVVQVSLSLLITLYEHERLQVLNEQRLVDAAEQLTAEVPHDSSDGLATAANDRINPGSFGRVAIIDSDGAGHLTLTGPFGLQRFDELRAAVAAGAFGTADEPASGQTLGYYFASQPYGATRRLVLAVPTEEADAPLYSITRALLLLLAAGVAASGMSAWYVSGLVVRPLRRVRHFAEELTADNVGGSLEMEDHSPELESLREELGLAMRRISAGYEAQARFLSNISHEVKTPIAVVRTEGEVLLAGDPSEQDWRRFAANTVEEMERLGRMVESFLLLTRIRHGKSRVQAQRHAANDVLMESVGHCLSMARQYSVRLEPELYEGEQDLEVEGNMDLLVTALSNLIRNAIRFSPRDRAVKISCGQRGQRVVFRVRDSGPGIPPEVLEHLFEPFAQSDGERSLGRGTGLGLQIAHGIAELHDGEVRIRNIKNGCESSLRLRAAWNEGNPPQEDEPAFT
jgi:signal transduction histidine kinase